MNGSNLAEISFYVNSVSFSPVIRLLPPLLSSGGIERRPNEREWEGGGAESARQRRVFGEYEKEEGGKGEVEVVEGGQMTVPTVCRGMAEGE